MLEVAEYDAESPGTAGFEVVLDQASSDGCRPDRAERVPALPRVTQLPELASARSGLRYQIPQLKVYIAVGCSLQLAVIDTAQRHHF